MIKKTLIVLFLAFIFSLGFSQKNRNINYEEQNGFYAPRNYNNHSVIPQTLPQINSATSVNVSPDELENLDALALPESSTLATNTVPPTEKEMVYDGFDRLIQVKVGGKIYKYAYDYRGRRIVVDETEAGGKYITITYSGGNAILESEADSPNAPSKIKRLYHRGPDMGGGVGGINYTTDVNGNNPIYYHYNSRGDVVMKTDQNNNVVWAATYEDFGKFTTIINNGDDDARQRSNTKETDPTDFINEGHRYRDPDLGIFLTPDPLEYVDGFNPYIYVNQNPWGRWDPEGLAYVISNELSDEDRKYAENIISKIASSSYGKDKSSVFYKIANDANIKVNVSVENTPFGVNGNGNRFDEGSNTIIINKNDIESNSAYVLDSGNGKVELSTVSPESMFVHESTHALDAAQGKDLKKTHNSEYGNNILETDSRAVAEGNKYRESVGEKKRLAYDSYDYDKNNPGKIKNPEEFRKTEKVIKDNNDAHLSKMYAERQKKIENSKGKKDK